MSDEKKQMNTKIDMTRPFYWSVWRELWENRSIYIAPLIVAAVQVFALAMSTIGIAERRRAVLLLDDPVKQRAAIEAPYDMAAMSYGCPITFRCCAGSSINAARLRCGIPIVLIRKPNSTMAATISGAI